MGVSTKVTYDERKVADVSKTLNKPIKYIEWKNKKPIYYDSELNLMPPEYDGRKDLDSIILPIERAHGYKKRTF